MAETLTAIASMLWPLVVLAILLIFRRPLLHVVRSAERREWTLEVGGQKLSMKQLSDQQNELIADLQARIGELNEQVERQAVRDLPPNPFTDVGPSPRPAAEPPPAWRANPTEVESPWQVLPRQAPQPSDPPKQRPVRAVLWVDDQPQHSALLVDQLQRGGVRVDLAASSAEAVAKLGERRYGALVLAAGRTGDAGQGMDTALGLLRTARAAHPELPFLIYTGAEPSDDYARSATMAGATVLTASSAVLNDRLRTLELL